MHLISSKSIFPKHKWYHMWRCGPPVSVHRVAQFLSQPLVYLGLYTDSHRCLLYIPFSKPGHYCLVVKRVVDGQTRYQMSVDFGKIGRLKNHPSHQVLLPPRTTIVEDETYATWGNSHNIHCVTPSLKVSETWICAIGVVSNYLCPQIWLRTS